MRLEIQPRACFKRKHVCVNEISFLRCVCLDLTLARCPEGLTPPKIQPKLLSNNNRCVSFWLDSRLQLVPGSGASIMGQGITRPKIQPKLVFKKMQLCVILVGF